ncbi:serine peptidase [Amycolatopsis sp. NPDC004625]|uniref:serine peptidase n=1 Tax=Amycolatopsis sp. NPDC004625 TaxID=3154670 RepID=UPI0033A18396
MSAEVLGVHGVGNWRSVLPADRAAALQRDWSAALGVKSLEVAYYAHHLSLDHHGDDDLELLDKAFAGAPAELLACWMQAIALAGEPDHGRALAPIRQLAAWWVQRYGVDRDVADRFLAAFLGEVVCYFDPLNPARRQAVRTEVATAISLHRPRVVIAHSLGSVVTYETLWSYPALQVELLVTIGSPLGFPDRIHPLLQPAPVDGKGGRPPGVGRWVNVADPADMVAIPPRLKDHFTDVEDFSAPAGVGFTHAARRYLATSEVRSIVGKHLRTR